MGAPTRIRATLVGTGRAEGPCSEQTWELEPINAPEGEYVDAQSFDAAATALQAAYGGLRSAENQFAAMRESQQAGHFPEVHNNPEKFAEKADAAARALARLGLPTSPAPIDRADVTREVDGAPSLSGAGGDQPSGTSPEPNPSDTAAFTSGGPGSGGDPSRAGGRSARQVVVDSFRGDAPEGCADAALAALNDAGFRVLTQAEIAELVRAGATS